MTRQIEGALLALGDPCPEGGTETRWNSYSGLLTPSTAKGLGVLGLNMPEQKYEYTLSETYVPSPVTAAAHELQRALGFMANTAILKRYEKGIDSGAYSPHTDPERFSRRRLVLCNVYGKAMLSITRGPRIALEPNTTTVLHPAVEHAVSEPTNKEGVRIFLFLGYDYLKNI